MSYFSQGYSYGLFTDLTNRFRDSKSYMLSTGVQVQSKIVQKFEDARTLPPGHAHPSTP